MKRILVLVLSLTLILTGCASSKTENINKDSNSNISTENLQNTDADNVPTLEFDGLNDEALLTYVEDLVYQETVKSLNSDEYVVEAVKAVYVSDEYLKEMSFNSQSNIFFGYTLADLNEFFGGNKYIFTLGDDGNTIVQAMQEIPETDMDEVIKNVAIGSGVIFVCVTISVVSAGAGAPAVAAIFAASAKGATTFALSSAAFGGISAGIVRGYQTGDVGEAVETALVSGSEGFKWGAISGTLMGGGKEAFVLKSGTKAGLTMNEVALVQKESQLPMDVISQLHSMDEYLVYKQAGLKTMMVNGRVALVPDIDLNYVSKLADGTEVTNLVRMQKGLAPIDPVTRKAYQLHHIGQKMDGTLAVLNETQHQGNSTILNIIGKESEIDRKAFDVIRKNFWKDMGYNVFGGL